MIHEAAILAYFAGAREPEALSVTISDQNLIRWIVANTKVTTNGQVLGRSRLPALGSTLRRMVKNRQLTRAKGSRQCACCGRFTTRWEYSLRKPDRYRKSRPNGTAARLGL